MNGIIIVNKETNMTSRDVVNKLMHIFNTKHIGHTGTLDPLATGVLVCVIGKYTKLCDDLTSTYKEYIAEFKLGIKTDTYDITGNITNTSNKKVTDDEITNTIKSYIKTYNQEVPIYSSVKINGRKLYEYARNNESIILPKREVTIKNIDILEINNTIKIKCLVSKGTYIRSLINDIGISLGTYATMTSLCRTKQGIFDIKDSYTLEDIKNNNYKLLKLEDVLDLDIINTSDKLYKLINNGVSIDYNSDKEYLLFKYHDEDISLYKKINNKYHMYIYLK